MTELLLDVPDDRPAIAPQSLHPAPSASSGQAESRGLHRAESRWTREEIRAARVAPLVPLLEKRGLTLVEAGAGNFHVTHHPGLVVKDCYWRGPEYELAGNAIDFLMQIERLSFHDAMRELTQS